MRWELSWPELPARCTQGLTDLTDHPLMISSFSRNINYMDMLRIPKILDYILTKSVDGGYRIGRQRWKKQ
jgi:hypothetical protein